MLRGAGPLLGSAHLEPSLAVTLAACALAVGAGLGTRTVVVALAVGSGQLSIGWSNDWLDWRRDQAAGRRDKPVAQQRVSPRAVMASAVAAIAVCVAASLALSVAAGLVHLVAVAAGWSYNVHAKHTWYSVAPWALAFGLLPAVVTLTAPLGRWPAWWVLVAGAALGSGAHFANAIPDLEHDRATGVSGLPHRLGRRRSLFAALGLVAVGIVAVATFTARARASVSEPVGGDPSAVLGGGAALLLVAVAVAALRGRDRLAFHGVVMLLLLLAVSVVVAGTRIL